MEEDIVLTQIKGLKEYLKPDEESSRGLLSKQRQGAREKLTKLSKQQFKELSIDVFDEMNRRVDCAIKPAQEQVLFLPVRDDFHPKRNQTRQKLATLPEGRYKDLASDVFFELCRRYPEIKSTVDAMGSGAPAPNDQEKKQKEQKEKEQREREQKEKEQKEREEREKELKKKEEKEKDAKPTERAQAPKPPVKKKEINVTEVDNDFANLNFESLDSLMADLGNMILTAPRKDSQAPLPTSASAKGTEPIPEIQVETPPPTIIEEPSQETTKFLEETRKSFIVSKAQTATLKEQHKEEIRAVQDYHNQKVTKLEEDHKALISQYEQRILEMESKLQAASQQSQQVMEKEAQHNQLMEENETLSKKIAGLELSLRQEEEKVRSLGSQVSDEREGNKQLQAKMENLEAENAELTEKLNSLMEDLTNRLRQKDQELSIKIRELRELVDLKNSIEMDRNEIQVEVIAIKEENRSIKEKLRAFELKENKTVSQSEKSLRSLARQQTSQSMQVSITEELVFNEGESMKDLVKGIQELLAASNESNPSKILTAMKAIVMTVRRHLDDAEEYEKSRVASFTPDEKEKFTNLQNDISEKLTSLVVVAKAHAGGKFDGSHSEAISRMEGLSTSLSNVVVRLLGGMTNNSGGKSKEYDIEDLPTFLDKQTNIIVQSIQTLLLVIKNPTSATQDFLSAIDSLVSSVTLMKNVISHFLAKHPDHPNRDRIDLLLRSLSEGISKSLSIRETVSSGAPRPPNQAVASTAFDIAKNTKEIVILIN